MRSTALRWSAYGIVVCCVTCLGCGRAELEAKLAETQRVAEQAAADTAALRKELHQALEKNNQLAEQLRAANAEAERQRKARAEADRQRAALAEAQRQRQTQTVYRPVLRPEAKFAPSINLSSRPPKKAVDIFVHSVSVYSTKDGRKEWDDGGPPDLKVEITNLDTGESFETKTVHDTESADYHCKALRVFEGQRIRIKVIDDDVFIDDTAGVLTKQVTADTMTLGRVNWTFDRVASLVLEFQP